MRLGRLEMITKKKLNIRMKEKRKSRLRAKRMQASTAT